MNRPINGRPEMRLGLALLITATAAADIAKGEVTIEQIERAWRDREARLTAGRISWVDRTHEFPGRKLGAPPADPAAEPATPAESDRRERTAEFVWSGDKTRYEFRGWIYSEIDSAFHPTRHASVAGGPHGSRHSFDTEGEGYVSGTIFTGDEMSDRGFVDLEPILLWARPLAACGSDIDLSEARIVDQDRREGDRAYVVIARPRGDRIDEWTVDPERDFTVRRYEVRQGDRPVVLTEIDYAPHEVARWVPDKWRARFWPGRRLASDTIGTFTAYSGAESVGADAFDLPFPEGAWVNDQGRDVSYIVLPGGSERIVTSDELRKGAKYPDLVRSPLGAAGAKSSFSVRKWLFRGALAVLLLSITISVIRKLRGAGK